MVLRVGSYSLAIIILLYLTVIFLPESININEDVSRSLFVIMTAIFFAVSKEKWWIKIVSTLLGLVVFLILIVLLVP